MGPSLRPAAISERNDPIDRRLRALMVDAQAGNKQSYAQLLVECEPVIRRAARRVGAHPDLADDIVQETLITLHGARQTFDPARSFTAWISVIAQRRAIDILRRGGRSRRQEVHSPAEYEQHADPNADAASGWRESARAEELARAISSLTPGQREAVQAIAVEGLTLAEASATTGRSKGALKVNFHRALSALKHRLGREEGRDD